MRNSQLCTLSVIALAVSIGASLVGVFASHDTGKNPVRMASGPGPMPTGGTGGFVRAASANASSNG